MRRGQKRGEKMKAQYMTCNNLGKRHYKIFKACKYDQDHFKVKLPLILF